MKEIYEDFHSGSGSKDFGFREQIQRARVSVMNNLAEGFERSTGEDGPNYLCAGYKGHFTHINQPIKTMAGLLLPGAP